MRIPEESVFHAYAGRKVRSIPIPEWDLKRIRAKREAEKKRLLDSQIEVKRQRGPTGEDALQELRLSQSALEPIPTDFLPPPAPSVFEGVAGDIGGESLMELPDDLREGALPRRGQASPGLRLPPVQTPPSASHESARRLPISQVDWVSLDPDALEAFFDEHGAAPGTMSPHAMVAHPPSSRSPDASELELAPDAEEDEEESVLALDMDEVLDDSPLLILEPESDDGVLMHPSDLELEPHHDHGTPQQSDDFHDLLRDLAERDDLQE